MFENFNYGTLAMILAAGGIALYLNHLNKKEKSDPLAALYKDYEILTADRLAAISDDDVVRAVAVNVLSKTDRRHPDVYRLIPTLSYGRIAVYTVWLYCNELAVADPVNWLHSETGRLADVAVDAFALVGAEQTAAALQAVTEAPDNIERVTALKAAVETEHPLTLCVTYIRDNSEEFIDS